MQLSHMLTFSSLTYLEVYHPPVGIIPVMGFCILVISAAIALAFSLQTTFPVLLYIRAKQVISEAVQNFKKRCPGVEVEVSVPDDLLFVPMDAMLIEQVLINLMDNAVKHGSGTTKISIRANADHRFARVQVADNGKGIEMKRLEHLFDGSLPLSGGGEADRSRNMGIGLSVCKTIVEAHGGTIFAQNRPGSGAEFIFTLELGGDENEYTG